MRRRNALLLAAIALAAAPGLPAAAAAAVPRVQAPAAVLVEPATGDIVFARNASQERPIASATKIMTALVTVERAPLDKRLVTVDYRATAAESIAGFRAGERVEVRDLLRALLLPSANDAAATLAQRIGGTKARFVRLMNEKAREIGLQHTHFTTPVGLDDPGNYSSATDLAKMALLLRENAFLRETVSRKAAILTSGARVRTVVSRNSLLSAAPWVDGVKTGHTGGAGYVLVGSATRSGVTVVSVVLGTPSEGARDADSLALLRYGLGQYRVADVVRDGARVASVGLAHRDESVALIPGESVRRTLRRGERIATTVVGVPREVDGPLPQGSQLGSVVVRQRGRVVATVPLLTSRDIAAATLTEKVSDAITSPVALVLAVLLACSLCLLLLRRRQRSSPSESEARTA